MDIITLEISNKKKNSKKIFEKTPSLFKKETSCNIKKYIGPIKIRRD